LFHFTYYFLFLLVHTKSLFKRDQSKLIDVDKRKQGHITSHLYGPSPIKAIRASGRLSMRLPKHV